MSVTLSGFFSGLDTNSIIAQLTAINRIPITNLQTEKSQLSDESSALGFVKSALSTLQSKLQGISDTNSFRVKTASLSDATVGTATADTTALAGSVKIEITKLATSSTVISGGAKAADVPAGTALAKDVFGASVVGTFTINNTQLTITNTTTLDDIATMMEGVSGIDAATTEYNATTGKFTIGSTGSLVLGTSGDTSNFLQSAQLFNSHVANGGPGKTVTSVLGAGRLNTTSTLGSITNFGGIAGAISGNGTMTINGVAIHYTTSDTMATLMSNINASDAGVVATYDSYADKFTLTAKQRGSTGISVVDTTGNLAQAMQLRTGTDTNATLGQATRFKVNDGDERESSSSTLSAEELGVNGLTFNPIQEGTTTVSIGADTTAIKSLIDDFVTQYNSVQSMVESYVHIDTTDPTKNGILAGNSTLTFLPSNLRTTVMSRFSDTGAIQMLEDIGITGNSSDNTITVSDSAKLADALNNHLDEVVSMFTDATNGLSAKLNPALDSYASDTSGVLANRQNSITDQQRWIDDEIERISAQVDAETLYLQAQFAAMEQITAQNQQLTKFFTSGSSGGTS